LFRFELGPAIARAGNWPANLRVPRRCEGFGFFDALDTTEDGGGRGEKPRLRARRARKKNGALLENFLLVDGPACAGVLPESSARGRSQKASANVRGQGTAGPGAAPAAVQEVKTPHPLTTPTKKGADPSVGAESRTYVRRISPLAARQWSPVALWALTPERVRPANKRSKKPESARWDHAGPGRDDPNTHGKSPRSGGASGHCPRSTRGLPTGAGALRDVRNGALPCSFTRRGIREGRAPHAGWPEARVTPCRWRAGPGREVPPPRGPAGRAAAAQDKAGGVQARRFLAPTLGHSEVF